MNIYKSISYSIAAVLLLGVTSLVMAQTENVGPATTVQMTGNITPLMMARYISLDDASNDKYGQFPPYASKNGNTLDFRYFVDAKFAIGIIVNGSRACDYSFETTKDSNGNYHTTVNMVNQVNENYPCGPATQSGGSSFTPTFSIRP